MTPLTSDLRTLLERIIIKARMAAEEAARAALTTLAVYDEVPYATLAPRLKKLRNALRARAKQLGNGDINAGFQPLKEEVAYEQWHRRFFARFLAENDLLIHPAGGPITLEECNELAREEAEIDGWEVAARYASLMLPGIFRADDPSAQVPLAPEGRHALETITGDVPLALFQADDTLGWAYQFWQTQQKKAVNASGRKISGGEISPVTQLFTEDYMVQFLLHNSLGAWWAVQHPESPLLRSFTYLRFRDDGTPAAGTFPGWPKRVAEVTVMDPCCGSGHFLVAAFEMLCRMRMEEEGLTAAQAGDAILGNNLFGLELDARCTQIAAFALAFTAWKVGGYRELPPLNIACSGTPVEGQWETWEQLAGDDENLREALKRQYNLFRTAPDLGSLIDPNNDPMNVGWLAADYSRIHEVLHQAIAREDVKEDAVAQVFGMAAEGAADAARLLAGKYTLIATNVPYLNSNKQTEVLKQFCQQYYSDAKGDLATAFLLRSRVFTRTNGAYALVTPQSWKFLGSYSSLRKRLLQEQTWNLVVNLGFKSFQTPMWDFNVGLSILTNSKPGQNQAIIGIDASEPRTVQEKANILCDATLLSASQYTQLNNPDARVALEEIVQRHLLSEYAVSYKGITTGDDSRFRRFFWEIAKLGNDWNFLQSTFQITQPYGGQEHILLWENGQGQLRKLAVQLRDRLHDIDRRGNQAWGKRGICISQMGNLPCALYMGELFDTNCASIIPKNPAHLPAIWAFCQSPQYNEAVRLIDQALKVTNATLVKVPFDLDYWQKIAEEVGSLPEPYSNDPTQWLFEGHPVGSTSPLQVAVARLLGYHWPQQGSDNLDELANKDAIVCLPAVAGAETGVEQLRALLAAAYGEEWSPEVQERLLAEVGFSGKSLEVWLRDGFFVQHCKLFHNRPFIWHVWDGLKDGFAALVNYHRLDTARLDILTYTYLGRWIANQKALAEAGVEGAETRYTAAVKLQKELEKIRIGESPYDIYVRWKALHEQPQGWFPDLNDGVRLNIRPFIEAGILRGRVSINWNKDRGTNPDGSERLNNNHFTLAEKQAAQARMESKK
ncbi:MAG TPA: DNA methyltransferase [Ktedonobacteraceae bacterium]|nr:DNA methyltransferase [Ktedonobacteraceae bacterium]